MQCSHKCLRVAQKNLKFAKIVEICNNVKSKVQHIFLFKKSSCIFSLSSSLSASANILLDSHLVPRLSDFGLARECSARNSQQSQFSTQSEVIMGTVAYMAPEFFRNRKLSPKTDVYSFGVVLLELYTGLAADDPTVPQRALVRLLNEL